MSSPGKPGRFSGTKNIGMRTKLGCRWSTSASQGDGECDIEERRLAHKARVTGER